MQPITYGFAHNVARLSFCLYLCTLNESDKRKVGYLFKLLIIKEL